MTYGMLASQSCLLTDIAHHLHEPSKKINIVDHLSQHLAKGTPTITDGDDLSDSSIMSNEVPQAEKLAKPAISVTVKDTAVDAGATSTEVPYADKELNLRCKRQMALRQV